MASAKGTGINSTNECESAKGTEINSTNDCASAKGTRINSTNDCAGANECTEINSVRDFAVRHK